MRECFCNFLKCLIANSEKLAHWATVIVLIFSFCLASEQLKELKDQKQWENFNAMNVRYAELLGKISDKVELSSGSFKSADEETKIWIRQYFDLYSEECWLNEKGLLPDRMFNDRIRPGVVVNLKKYPILKEGYDDWKELGAFKHPADFYKVVEEDIGRRSTK